MALQSVAADALPGPQREFRGAWLATVANIDWPSAPGLSTAEQQAELRAMLDRLAALHFNAVIFQVRPHADALYASELEPWSEYLTGTQGQAPSPAYDPLAFAVEEAHRRGMELHAWFNPYRAGHPAARSARHPSHISRTKPHIVRRYGDYLWLDPGEPEAAEHSLRVILDVVQRYDVDGVHLDDYFYPYPVQERGRDVPFPDDVTYRAAQAAGETLDRDDWRRQNVDHFIERLYREVKAARPSVKVGISPFGIWRPGHPPSVTGFDQYARLYADARKWQQEGWLDYMAPQLYWAISSRGQSFPALLDWWGEQNTAGRHLWPGLYDSRILPDVGGYTPQEIVDQVTLVRAHAVATGTIHFSAKALAERFPLGAALADGPYAAPALVPASPWLDGAPPFAPVVGVRPAAGGLDVTMEPAPGEAVAQWVVRTRYGSDWTWRIVPGAAASLRLDRRPDAVALSALDRAGNESPISVLDLPPPR
jgi:uncharacterized lipoprotein YddW (UPF0748 family)